MGFFRIAGLLHELGECLGFRGHLLGDLTRHADGFGGFVLNQLPLSGGEADLICKRAQVGELLDGADEALGFRKLEISAVLDQERGHAKPRRQTHCRDQTKDPAHTCGCAH